jgi:hypothetical protein
MAKLTYLQLTNRVLKRLTQPVITDVTAATGQALIITELINEAQNFLFTDTDWYSLYKTRKFSTVTYTASTISFFTNGFDSIDDGDSGLVTAGFLDGMQILVSGASTATNNGTWTINTVEAGALNLQSADAVTIEAAGEEITITAITYPVASDHGRTIALMDTSSERILIEDFMRSMDEADPDPSITGNPTHFAWQGSQYRLYPIPAGTYVMRERYWAVPTALAANSDTSDLPIETENCLIYYALWQICNYLNKFDQADRWRIEFEKQESRAKAANKRKIDIMLSFQADNLASYLRQPVLPASYDWRHR